MPPQPIHPEQAARLARIAIACVQREYPNQIAHAMRSDADAAPPRTLHPAFFGCYDWHSAVHTHWCLARLLRCASAGDPDWAAPARRALRKHLTPERLAAEAEYLRPDHRRTFERPYGLAWLLQLHAECTEWNDPDAASWAESLEPLAEISARRILEWAVALTHPVRTGVHSQSAFGLGLALDWARATGRAAIRDELARSAARLHAADAAWPLAFEPSGEDFLSPGLAAADLVRRVYDPDRFAAWLSDCLPDLSAQATPLQPAAPAADAPPDGRLAHLFGLNLSRAWMLHAIADALPTRDARPEPIRRMARLHAEAGLGAIDEADYDRAHWLGSFAVYLLTDRGRTAV